jgi:hypothetical protein
VLPKKIQNWSLASLQRLVQHVRYYCLMLAESHLTQRVVGCMVRHIDGLAVASG